MNDGDDYSADTADDGEGKLRAIFLHSHVRITYSITQLQTQNQVGRSCNNSDDGSDGTDDCGGNGGDDEGANTHTTNTNHQRSIPSASNRHGTR